MTPLSNARTYRGLRFVPGQAYIAPFMYVFDGKYLYFLSTKYGRKIEYFKSNPRVSVEIEEYAPDLSSFTFPWKRYRQRHRKQRFVNSLLRC